MTFISTSDSKTDSSNLIKMSAPPPFIIILTIISLLLAIPMMALSVVNNGMSSMCSKLTNSTVAGLDFLYHIVFLIVVFIHRKNFSSALEQHTDGAESFDYFDMAPFKPPSIAFSMWNITCLIFLLAANFIAFSVTVDDANVLRRAMGGTLSEWSFEIQVSQTVIVGCQLLTIATILGISARGWRRIILEEENRLQEAQYEF
jgi:hypothetical protein